MATGIAINVGLNSVDPAHYNGWSGRLKACESDARDMQELARSKGFDSRLLLTEDATVEAVTGALREAAGRLAQGDILFLTYSGHGGQVRDTNSDEPHDAMDETWVLYDRQLVDDELYAIWGEFQPGVRILVLSDSCHSGSVTREIFFAAVPAVVERGMVDDEEPRTKDLPADVQEETYRSNEGLYEEIQRSHKAGDDVEVAATILLISGCQDNQLSLDGRRNGLFTGTLLGVWEDGAWQGSHRRFWQAISAKMPPTQSPNFLRVGVPNASFSRQTPLTI